MSDLVRCAWVPENDLYQEYHDFEWGVPVHDDHKHFEMVTLEGAQAGLSWFTILKRREGYRAAYENFDPEKIARYDEAKIAELLQDEGIIRNKAKVNASVTNAQAFLAVQEEFGSFDTYIWGFVDGTPTKNTWESMDELPVFTPQAEALSKDLKKRGFKFVGPTTCYAHMQAAGLVNDHEIGCFRYDEV